MADSSVRRARLVDVEPLARVQLASWPTTPGLPTTGDPLPDLPEVVRAWERAVVAPPSPRHTVWCALSGERVVGLAALGPATDPDLDAESTTELLTLVVAAEDRGHGHGSRLLAATMQSLRDDGQHVVVTWLTTQDDGTRAFLESAGWAPDGAFRTLATDEKDALAAHLRQLRMATDVSAEPDASQ